MEHETYRKRVKIDDILGNNLGRTYKTYDHYDKASQIATSFKSLDPMCKTYQKSSGLRGKLNRYAKQLMNGADIVVMDGREYKIMSRELNIVLPDVPLTSGQKDVINQFIEDNKDNFETVITILSD